MPRRFEILRRNKGFPANKANTARFTWKSYLPLALWEAFDPRYKITNLYFLILGALQFIPELTLSGGVSTIYINVGLLVVQDIIMMGVRLAPA